MSSKPCMFVGVGVSIHNDLLGHWIFIPVDISILQKFPVLLVWLLLLDNICQLYPSPPDMTIFSAVVLVHPVAEFDPFGIASGDTGPSGLIGPFSYLE